MSNSDFPAVPDFAIIWKTNVLDKLKFEKTELKSPCKGGVVIYANWQENILYKNMQRKIKYIYNYKNIIYNLYREPILCKYIFEPEKVYIEDDGSYYTMYIQRGIRLYDITLNTKLDHLVLMSLRKSISSIKKELNDYTNKKRLSGDWALHNLVYCLNTNKIYNVDLEGFYTYPLIFKGSKCCSIKYCNTMFDKLLIIITQLISNKFHIQINNLTYNRLKSTFIHSSDIPEIQNYLSHFYSSRCDNHIVTRTIQNPVFIIDTLDECYAHALIDRVFPYFWSLEEIDNKKDLIIFIMENKLKKFPIRKRVINHEKGVYNKSWNDIIHLLNPKEIIFEHLLKNDDILLFKECYIYAENNREFKWQRTFWNCNTHYPGRHINNVLYNDTTIQSRLNAFINMVKCKYSIIEKSNIVKNLVIIERLSNRKFDPECLSNLDHMCRNIPNLQYNGIQYLENISFVKPTPHTRNPPINNKTTVINDGDMFYYRPWTMLTPNKDGMCIAKWCNNDLKIIANINKSKNSNIGTFQTINQSGKLLYNIGEQIDVLWDGKHTRTCFLEDSNTICIKYKMNIYKFIRQMEYD